MENEKKTQAVAELKQLLSQDVAEVKEKVDELKNEFYREYRLEQENLRKAAEEAGEEWQPVQDAVEQEFRQLLADYKQRKAEYLKKKEEEEEQNLLRKQNIIAQMKDMAEAETADVMDNLQKMRDLQTEWKSIGSVPGPKVQDLWKQYNLYQEQFYDLVKINIELRDLDFKKNLDLKTALIEKAEALASENNIVEANRTLQQLHKEWSEVGPVARELRDELWNRFKEASSVINKKHQAYFDELHGKEQENLEKKRALIERLKAIITDDLKNAKAWDKATEVVQTIQNEWRQIGFAPKKFNQTIYDEYRAMCDAFFKAKTAYYKSIRNIFTENLKKKRELLAKAEELKDSENWKEATEAFIQLQNEWKTVGPVARKNADEIWKQFSEACDHFFEAKRVAMKANRVERAASRLPHGNREGDNLSARLMKNYETLQMEIRTAENNILFFTSKNGNTIVDSLQKKIESLKAQLAELEQKINQQQEEE